MNEGADQESHGHVGATISEVYYCHSYTSHFGRSPYLAYTSIYLYLVHFKHLAHFVPQLGHYAHLAHLTHPHQWRIQLVFARPAYFSHLSHFIYPVYFSSLKHLAHFEHPAHFAYFHFHCSTRFSRLLLPWN